MKLNKTLLVAELLGAKLTLQKSIIHVVYFLVKRQITFNSKHFVAKLTQMDFVMKISMSVVQTLGTKDYPTNHTRKLFLA